MAPICSFSHMAMDSQIYPHGGKYKMAAVARYEIGAKFCLQSLVNIYDLGLITLHRDMRDSINHHD